MTHVAPDSKALISSESKRLKEMKSYSKIRSNEFVKFIKEGGLDLDEIGELITEAKSIKHLFEEIKKRIDDPKTSETLKNLLDGQMTYTRADINEAREILGLKQLSWGQRKKLS